ERHIADPARDLNQMLAGHFGIGLPCDAMIGKELVQHRFIDELPAHQVDRRLADDLDVLRGVGRRHESLPGETSSLVGFALAISVPRFAAPSAKRMRRFTIRILSLWW